MATTDIPLSVFNEGFWMTHHGHMVFTFHVDFRPPGGRLPINSVVKFCEGKYAIEVGKTIKLARPDHFRHEGETLIYDINEARATREFVEGSGVESPVSREARLQLDEQIDRIAESRGWPTSRSRSNRVAENSRTIEQSLDWGKELLLFCTAMEPSSSTDPQNLVDSLYSSYDHESYIPSPRTFAQALGAAYAEHFGPAPGVSLFRDNVRLTVHRLCPFVWFLMVSDAGVRDPITEPTISGQSACRYLLTVFLLMPRSRDMPRIDTPLSLA